MQKLLLLTFILYLSCNDNSSDKPVSKKVPEEKPSTLLLIKNEFKEKIDSLIPLARSFAKRNGYNQRFVFVADLSLHSGFDRFAVVDLQKDSVVKTGLVAHGIGGRSWSVAARFSTVPNSLCSSAGKYRIGEKYNGRFGKAYKLHGLDKTNSKAFERFIVLHAYDCVPDKMPYPGFLCNSEGCPMVSYKFLDILSSYIDNSKQPILLWIIG